MRRHPSATALVSVLAVAALGCAEVRQLAAPPNDPLHGADMLTGVAVDPRTAEVWTTSETRGVERWSSDGRPLDAFTVADGLPSNAGNDVAIGPDGTVWVGTEQGVARRAPDGTWSALQPPLAPEVTFTIDDGVGTDEPGREPNAVVAVAADAEGGAWFGAVKGVARLAPDGAWELPPPPHDHLDKIGAIRPAPNGDVWIATLYDGLLVRRAGGRWQAWPRVGPSATTRVWDVGFLPDGRVLALHGDPERAGGGTRASASVQGEDGTWRSADLDAVAMVANGDAAYLQVDDDGRVWIGWQNGVLIVPDAGGGSHAEREPNGPAAYTIYGLTDIALGRDGSVWIAADLGLNRRAPDGGYTLHVSRPTPTPRHAR